MNNDLLKIIITGLSCFLIGLLVGMAVASSRRATSKKEAYHAMASRQKESLHLRSELKKMAEGLNGDDEEIAAAVAAYGAFEKTNM